MTITPWMKTTTLAQVPRKSRGTRTVLALAMCAALGIAAAPSAVAQISIGLAMPGVNIGINVPVYPDFEQMPGYPVYYAPSLDMNMFFYDGLYWNYIGDQWYSSSWYNGPWDMIGREYVPVFILRIPVRYYRRPPTYFRGWAGDEPPRWGDRWGRDWQQRREGWDRWDHRSPPAAPLPAYQRDFRGSRYPQPGQQRGLRDEHYTYHPQDAVARQHFDAAPTRQDGGRGPGSRADRPPAAAERANQADRPNPGVTGRPSRPPASTDSPQRNGSPDRRPEAQRAEPAQRNPTPADRPPPQDRKPTPQRTEPQQRNQAPERRAEPQRMSSPVRTPAEDRRPEQTRAQPVAPRNQPAEQRQQPPRPDAQPRSRPEPAAAQQKPERSAPPGGRGGDKRDEDRSPRDR